MSVSYSDRIARARKIAETEGFDALWINDPANVRYLSGFTGSSGFILLGPSGGKFLTDSRYGLQAQKEVKALEAVVLGGGLSGALRGLAGDLGVKRLAFSPSHASYAHVVELRRAVRGIATIGPLKESLTAMRAVKEPDELSALRKAVRRAESALLMSAKVMRPGCSEKQVSTALDCHIRETGCEDRAFDLIVAGGARSALPHASPTERVLRNDDILLVDWGARCDGYHSDLTRVFYIGEPGREMREIHRIVQEARKAALRAIHPGVKASEVDGEARRVIREAGYEKYFGHALGHGVGLEVHESPSISRPSRDVLQAGMVFTIEPGIYLPGRGGVRIEDVVYLAPDGVRVLSRLPRNGEMPRKAPVGL